MHVLIMFKTVFLSARSLKKTKNVRALADKSRRKYHVRELGKPSTYISN